MAYSLYVSGAQEFLPAFYRELFRTGSVAQAVARGPAADAPAEGEGVRARPLSAGRLAGAGGLSARALRLRVRGARRRRLRSRAAVPGCPPRPRDTENPYGFIGRDGAVLALERAIHQRPAGALDPGPRGRGQDDAGPRLPAVAARHRRPGQRLPLALVPGHPLRRVRPQPHGRAALRPRFHGGRTMEQKLDAPGRGSRRTAS